MSENDCKFDHPHDGHPCGRRTEAPGELCHYCGDPVPVDGSPCPTCWKPMTVPVFRGWAASLGFDTDVEPDGNSMGGLTS